MRWGGVRGGGSATQRSRHRQPLERRESNGCRSDPIAVCRLPYLNAGRNDGRAAHEGRAERVRAGRENLHGIQQRTEERGRSWMIRSARSDSAALAAHLASPAQPSPAQRDSTRAVRSLTCHWLPTPGTFLWCAEKRQTDQHRHKRDEAPRANSDSEVFRGRSDGQCAVCSACAALRMCCACLSHALAHNVNWRREKKKEDRERETPKKVSKHRQAAVRQSSRFGRGSELRCSCSSTPALAVTDRCWEPLPEGDERRGENTKRRSKNRSIQLISRRGTQIAVGRHNGPSHALAIAAPARETHRAGRVAV